MIVVDSSAIVGFLLAPEANPQLAFQFKDAENLVAPGLIDVECASALRRLELNKKLEAKRATRALELYGLLRLVRYPALDLLPLIWRLRHNFSAYDATYVALAITLDAPLLSLDQKLKTAVKKHTAIALI